MYSKLTWCKPVEKFDQRKVVEVPTDFDGVVIVLQIRSIKQARDAHRRHIAQPLESSFVKAPWQGGDLGYQIAANLAHNIGAIRPRLENVPVIPLQMVFLPTLHESLWLRELQEHLLLLAVIAVHGSREPVAELSLELLLLCRLQF